MSGGASRAKITAVTIAVVGVLAATVVIGFFNFHAVLSAMARVGWGGFAAVIACQLALFAPLGLAWLVVAPELSAARLGLFSWGRLMREAASDVLPFSQLGGFVIGARAIMLGGVPGPVAFGSGVVDVTFEVLAQLAYTLIGVGLLVLRLGAASKGDNLVWMLSLGLCAAAGLVAVFMFAQRKGARLAERIAERLMPAAATHTASFTRAIESAYAQPLRLWIGWVIHVACWFGAAVGSWLILRLIGQPLPFHSVVAIESLLFAIRNAAFVVPGGLGVQEGAYALLGPLFGLPAEAALALSLLKRARDMVIGIPALLIWQVMEGRRPVAGR
ncbi:MAG: lysylphosphatidylglycerol synthase domain-containing protein [Caulobacteraceae bacterium]|nr:lysylphosphatidylglycerol synthase domain-containing protein [Caulobacteraceae bacterium]